MSIGSPQTQTKIKRRVAVAPEELADMLLESIVDGQFPVESVLPSEGTPAGSWNAPATPRAPSIS